MISRLYRIMVSLLLWNEISEFALTSLWSRLTVIKDSMTRPTSLAIFLLDSTELLFPSLLPPLQASERTFAQQYAHNISSNSSIDFATLLSRAPNVITAPVSYQIANIRPFDVLV